jgi:hypothetical protein
MSPVGHSIRPRADETPALNETSYLYIFEDDFNGISVRG